MEVFRLEDKARNIRSIGFKSRLTKVEGKLHLTQVDEESSILIWDQCRLWYSFDGGKMRHKSNFLVFKNIFNWTFAFPGRNITEAVFYLHKELHGENTAKHLIKGEHCHFGVKASVAIGGDNPSIIILI